MVVNNNENNPVEIVECDNCGEHYAVFRDDPFTDKANYWVAVSYQCVDDKHRQRAEKHRHKWLELARKFKEVGNGPY